MQQSAFGSQSYRVVVSRQLVLVRGGLQLELCKQVSLQQRLGVESRDVECSVEQLFLTIVAVRIIVRGQEYFCHVCVIIIYSQTQVVELVLSPYVTGLWLIMHLCLNMSPLSMGYLSAFLGRSLRQSPELQVYRSVNLGHFGSSEHSHSVQNEP